MAVPSTRARGRAAGTLWNEAQQLARLVIARGEDWPTSGWLSPSPSGRAAALLSALRQSGDIRNIEALLAEVSAVGCYDAGDNKVLADAAMLLPAERAAGLVTRVIVRNAPLQVTACAELLQGMAARLLARSAAGASTELLEPAAQAVVAALPGDPAAIPTEGWRRPLPVTPRLVVDLLTALCHLGARSLGEQAGSARMRQLEVPVLSGRLCCQPVIKFQAGNALELAQVVGPPARPSPFRAF